MIVKNKSFKSLEKEIDTMLGADDD